MAQARAISDLRVRGFWLSGFVAVLAWNAHARAQVGAEESAKKLKPAPGLEATLWAAEPMVVNPTNMDIDSRGRVWITEGLNYRPTRNRSLPRKDDADKIKILEDTDGDGKADKMTVFADKIFPVPMGIAVEEHWSKEGKYLGSKVFIGNSPDLLVLEDTDGDDVADKRYPLLTGFGGIDSDHGVHGMVLGLDGRLYFSHGDGCCSVQADHSERQQNFDVVDQSGRRVSSANLANTLRVNRDGTMFEILADRQRNNYETCLNAFGNNFTSDNDDDGNRGCRVIWVMDGGHYGYRTPGSPRHWGEEVPGNTPKIVGTGNGSPCGLMVYEGSLLPAEYQGAIFEAEAGTRQINDIRIERHGAGFHARLGVLLASDDPWFRPVDATAAPDGSVFVADWYDAGVGGHSFRDQTTGRIYRVAPRGAQARKVAYDFASVPGLIEALKSPVIAAQDSARRGLIAHGKDAAGPLRTLFAAGSPIERARALWVLYAIEGDAPALAALGDRDPRIREQAVRILARDISHNGDVQSTFDKAKDPWPNPRCLLHLDRLAPLAADSDSGVRRELILALRDAPTDRVGGLLATLAAGWDGSDRWYLEALGSALEKRESAFIKSLLSGKPFSEIDIASEGKRLGVAVPPYFPADRNEAYIAIGTPDPAATPLSKAIGIAWRLHRPEVLPFLTEILPGLQTADLRQAGDEVLNRINDPSGAKVLAALVQRSGDAVRKRELLGVLARKLDRDWAEAKGDEAIIELTRQTLRDPALRTLGISLVLGEKRWLDELSAFSNDAALGEDVRTAAIRAIGAIRAPESRAILIGVIQDAKVKKFATPEANAALRALTRQGDAKPVFLEMITSADYPLGLRKEALRSLAGNRESAGELLAMARDGKLPAELKTEAALALNSHPDRGIRDQAQKDLPLEKSAGRTLPPIERLIRSRGDAGRGREVFTRAKEGLQACSSCHRVQGMGNWIGPDLSTIGVKYGKDELLRSILNPSAAIGYNFRTLTIATKDGTVASGLVVEESPAQITLKTSEGKRLAFKTSEIEEKAYMEVSLMPEGLAQQISDGDIVDLLEFLSSLKSPVSIVGQYHVLGPIAEPAGASAIVPTAHFDPVRAGAVGGKPAMWRKLSANYESALDLDAGSGGEGAIHLAAPLSSPLVQSARLVLEAPQGTRAWLGDRELNLSADAASKGFFADVELPAGETTLWLRVPKAPAKVTASFVCPQALEFR